MTNDPRGADADAPMRLRKRGAFAIDCTPVMAESRSRTAQPSGFRAEAIVSLTDFCTNGEARP